MRGARCAVRGVRCAVRSKRFAVCGTRDVRRQGATGKK